MIEKNKTIELCLFDEKRRKIKQGENISFINVSHPDDTFTAKVVQLHQARNFKDLCQKITPASAGFSSAEELLDVLAEFYPLPSQKKFGIVGIEIAVQSENK